MDTSKKLILDFFTQYIKLLKSMEKPLTIPTIYEFVYENGKFFDGKGKLDKRDCGEMKECYRNSFILMINRRDLYYCEGFATSKGVPLPLLHAWCVDKDGKVYDPTWRDDGDGYYGIAFDRKFTSFRFLRKRNSGCLIDDWRGHWPLLSGKEKKKWRAKI